MLDFKGISVHYGHQDVLTDVTFRVNKGDRVGVVGPNGSGKSTLFKIVLGEMIPQNDIWIAASALEHGFELLTHDGHFSRIPMLNVIEG